MLYDVDSREEWDMELEAFAAAGAAEVPEWTQNLVKKLWAQYCFAQTEIAKLREGTEE